MKIAGIYKIRSLKTGRIYVGESLDIRRRFVRHRTDLRYGIHCNPYLQRHVNKHGLHDLIFEIQEELSPCHTLLLEHEKYWIQHFNSHGRGFNLNKGGQGGASTRIKYRDFNLIRIRDGELRSFHTINDYEDAIGHCSKHIREVLRGKRFQAEGWTTEDFYWKKFYKPPQRPRKKSPPPINSKNFSLLNIKTRERVVAKNVAEFSRVRHLCYNCLLRVIRGERKQHKGWVLTL